MISLEMHNDPLLGLAKSAQGPQSPASSRYQLLGGIQVVNESNQDASYTAAAPPYALRKQQGISG